MYAEHFCNVMDGTSAIDAEGLCTHLVEEFPDHAKGFSAVLQQRNINPLASYRFVAKGIIHKLLSQPKKQDRSTTTRQTKKDNTPYIESDDVTQQRIDQMIARTGKEKWEAHAAAAGKSVEEFIAQTRQELYRSEKTSLSPNRTQN